MVVALLLLLAFKPTGWPSPELGPGYPAQVVFPLMLPLLLATWLLQTGWWMDLTVAVLLAVVANAQDNAASPFDLLLELCSAQRWHCDATRSLLQVSGQ